MRNFKFNQILVGDVRERIKEIPDSCVDVIITSPPYWGLRERRCENQIGTEKTIEEYVKNIVSIMSLCKSVLKKDGLMFLNIGDTYFNYWGNSKCSGNQPPSYRSGYNENDRPKFKPHGWQREKQKCLIPHRVAIGLQDDGWIIRNDIFWHKPNYRPESVKHRLNCCGEYWFFCCLNPRTKRFRKGNALKTDLWAYASPTILGHTATFPEEIILDILDQCECDVVFDPFIGSGSTAVAATKNKIKYIGVEIDPIFAELATDRISQVDFHDHV